MADACFAQTAQALDQQGGSGHGIGAVNQVVEEFVILLGRDLELLLYRRILSAGVLPPLAFEIQNPDLKVGKSALKL